jgi:hypothetical protein
MLWGPKSGSVVSVCSDILAVLVTDSHVLPSGVAPGALRPELRNVDWPPRRP